MSIQLVVYNYVASALGLNCFFITAIDKSIAAGRQVN